MGDGGSLTLGFDAAMAGWDTGHAFGTVDYLHHIADTPFGEFSAFGHGFGGASLAGGAWAPEFGFTAGVGVSW